jgi:uncharacterized membrane protein (UPF0127 family)
MSTEVPQNTKVVVNTPDKKELKYRKYLWLFFLIFPIAMKDFDPRTIGNDMAIELPIEGQMLVGNRAIQLEVASNSLTRSRGLNYRHDIPSNRGMLYRGLPKETYFSGKNNKFNTELIFLLGNQVVDMREVTSCNEDKCLQYRTNERYDAVVEVKSGVTKVLGIARGVQVTIDLIPNSQ